MDADIRCLFWNLGRSNRDSVLAGLIREGNIDTVLLAENGSDQDLTLSTLKNKVSQDFFAPRANTQRLHVLTRRTDIGLQEAYGTANGRITLRVLRLNDVELLLGIVHLPSQRNWSERDLLSEAGQLAGEIRREEERRGHRRTILIGDFNMNPFDAGMVSAAALHATSTQSVASRKKRVVQGVDYPYFYNPMWGNLGDRTPGPAGTLYYRSPGHVSYDWNMLDQMLIRPEAIQTVEAVVAVLHESEAVRLTKGSGRPDKSVGSDHFPLLLILVRK